MNREREATLEYLQEIARECRAEGDARQAEFVESMVRDIRSGEHAKERAMERTDELWLVLKVSEDRRTTLASWGPFEDEETARYRAKELADINVGEDFYILSAKYVASKRVAFDKIEEIPF